MDDEIAEEVFDAEIIETDINDLCRICGSTSDGPLVPIYDENGLAEDLAGKIMSYLPIKLSEDDMLPIKICLNCTNGILTWHLLYECCVDADRKFQAMLSEETLQPPQAKAKESRDIPDDGDNLIEEKQEETEMEDVMFLRAEFGPEDEQYLEDETRLADGELELKCDDRQPMNVENCEHFTMFCYTCSNEIEDIEDKIVTHLEAALYNCDIRCKQCDEPWKSQTIVYRCGICNKTFPTKSQMTTHRSQHEHIYCRICFKYFKSYAAMVAHRKIHDEDLALHTCPICDYNSYRKFNMQLHINSHIQDYPCRICCNSFNSEQILESHKANHVKSELADYNEFNTCVQCNECKEVFNSRYILYFHTVAKHNSDDEKFICSQCNRIFESAAILRHHENSHKEKAYKCEVCNKTFSKLKNYNEHRNVHKDNRPFQCHVCLLRFKYSSNLSQHKGIHKGVKNFACHYCDRKFTRSNTLNVHLKTHRNERNFTCKYCDSAFVQSSTLYKHMRALHRTCEQCGKMIGDRKQCQTHLWNCSSSSAMARSN